MRNILTLIAVPVISFSLGILISSPFVALISVIIFLTFLLPYAGTLLKAFADSHYERSHLMSILALRHEASARELTFNPDVSKIEVFERFTPPASYKETRSKEICEMAKEQGFTDKDCEMMIAHLLSECGSMTEYCGWTEGSYASDAGLAFGIAQWHSVTENLHG